jgi:hypothetical protein
MAFSRGLLVGFTNLKLCDSALINKDKAEWLLTFITLFALIMKEVELLMFSRIEKSDKNSWLI